MAVTQTFHVGTMKVYLCSAAPVHAATDGDLAINQAPASADDVLYVYAAGSWTANATGGGGGGGGAPTTADYLTKTANGSLSAERVVTDTTSVVWDWATAGQAKATVQFGTSATTACVGNDSRLSDARTPTAHHTSHEPGGTDAMAVDAVAATGSLRTLGTGAQQAAAGNHTHAYSSLTAIPSTFAPSAHAASHAAAGSDPLTIAESQVTNLVTDLAAKEATANKGAASGYASLDGSTKVPIAQLPTGTTASTVCLGNDSRLSDARTPTAHATSHKSGGSDAIKLDELAAPTDVTTLNASATAHGLLPKLDGTTTNFLRGDGSWAAPTATVAAPITGSYAPGSFTIADGQFGLMGGNLALTTTQTGTIAGTGCLIIDGV